MKSKLYSAIIASILASSTVYASDLSEGLSNKLSASQYKNNGEINFDPTIEQQEVTTLSDVFQTAHDAMDVGERVKSKNDFLIELQNGTYQDGYLSYGHWSFAPLTENSPYQLTLAQQDPIAITEDQALTSGDVVNVVDEEGNEHSYEVLHPMTVVKDLIQGHDIDSITDLIDQDITESGLRFIGKVENYQESTWVTQPATLENGTRVTVEFDGATRDIVVRYQESENDPIRRLHILCSLEGEDHSTLSSYLENNVGNNSSENEKKSQ